MSVDPGIELGLTVLVTSRRYRQTNSAQALKETDIRVRVRVRCQGQRFQCKRSEGLGNCNCFDQDEAARSSGEQGRQKLGQHESVRTRSAGEQGRQKLGP